MSIPQLRFKQKLLLSVLAVTTALAIVTTTLFSNLLHEANAFPQQNERLVHGLPVHQDEPIVITGIKVKGQTVLSDVEFTAPDDWLKDLVFSVKNRSDKTIRLVALTIQFPRPPGSSEKISVAQMFYGNPEFFARKPREQERSPVVTPGEDVDIQLTSQEFERWKEFLGATGYASNIERINFRLDQVLFEDDTMWNSGKILTRDKSDPIKWIIQPTSQGKARSPNFAVGVTGIEVVGVTASSQTREVDRRYLSLRQMFPSLIQRFLPNTEMRSARSFPQNTCWKESLTGTLSCEVPGHTCTYLKDT